MRLVLRLLHRRALPPRRRGARGSLNVSPRRSAPTAHHHVAIDTPAGRRASVDGSIDMRARDAGSLGCIPDSGSRVGGWHSCAQGFSQRFSSPPCSRSRPLRRRRARPLMRRPRRPDRRGAMAWPKPRRTGFAIPRAEVEAEVGGCEDRLRSLRTILTTERRPRVVPAQDDGAGERDPQRQHDVRSIAHWFARQVTVVVQQRRVEHLHGAAVQVVGTPLEDDTGMAVLALSKSAPGATAALSARPGRSLSCARVRSRRPWRRCAIRLLCAGAA